MKKPLALLAAFVLLFVVGATLGIAQANPQTAPETTTTPSTTPTVTETPTLTATPPCSSEPVGPQLTSPTDGATVNKTTVKLHWEAVPCAYKYRILVRRGSNSGIPVTRGKTGKLVFKTDQLSRGYTYFWNIKSCVADQGCTRSDTWKFKIPAPPTSVPPPTGQATSTPPPGGSGTPVPGVPPSNLVNYYTEDRGGTGVYLYDSPQYLYRFECGKDSDKWVPFGVGATVYNVALWYYANEQVKMERLDFNAGQTVETKNLAANGSGYVSYDTNTGSWTPDHHYHLIFTGKSSGTVWCGHFDIQSGAVAAEILQALPHSRDDVIRVYRAAGLPDPK